MNHLQRKRLRVLYEALDQALAARVHETAQAGRPVSCRAGCSHCCYLTPQVSHLEVENILAAVVRTEGAPGLRRLRERCAVPPQRVARGVRCVLLTDDHRCSVYDARPASCRAHMVVSEPDQCALDEIRYTWILNTDDALGGFLSELHSEFGQLQIGPLPDMLLAALATRGVTT